MTSEMDTILAREQEAARHVGDAYRGSDIYRFRARVWFAALICCAISAASALLHFWADWRWGEDEPAVIYIGTYIVGIFSRIGFLITYPMIVFLVIATMAATPGAWKRFLRHWVLTAMLIMIVLTVFRGTLAPLLSNEVLRPYPPTDPVISSDFHFLGWEEWHARWRIGIIHAIEFGYVILMCAIPIAFTPYARLVPGTGLLWFYAGMTCVAQYAVTVFYPHLTGVVNWDYDTFLGGTFTDSLSLQAMFIAIPIDPISTIACPTILLFVIATYYTYRRILPDLACPHDAH